MQCLRVVCGCVDAITVSAQSTFGSPRCRRRVIECPKPARVVWVWSARKAEWRYKEKADRPARQATTTPCLVYLQIPPPRRSCPPSPTILDQASTSHLAVPDTRSSTIRISNSNTPFLGRFHANHCSFAGCSPLSHCSFPGRFQRPSSPKRDTPIEHAHAAPLKHVRYT